MNVLQAESYAGVHLATAAEPKSSDAEQKAQTRSPIRMGLRALLSRWLRSTLLDSCPACSGEVRRHEVRTLARERLCPGKSGIEDRIERGDYRGAAALDDPGVLGDQLVHQLVRCGDKVAVVSTEDPVGFDLDARIRRVIVLEGIAASLAWQCAL